ncbi:MAG: ornithine cyclodeaminase family protein, partial [Mesorhizobium sp.]
MTSAISTSRSAQAKGDMPVLILSEAEVKTCIDLRQLLDVLAGGFKALS